MDELAQRIVSGEVRALGRGLRIIDDRRPGWRALLKQLFSQSQQAWVLGITGSPGAGKSTLLDALVSEYRTRGKRVGVLAIDPSSPFSGGALLGDRIRLSRHFEDSQVFIRSLATRGALGGLSRSTLDSLVLLAAWGAEIIIVETVGVGQDELDIIRVADTTCVLLTPGMGDDVQATKAGILECADVFVVNKADRPGADAVVRDIETMLQLGASVVSSVHHGHRLAHFAERTTAVDTPPIVLTVATTQKGLPELVAAVESHQRQMLAEGRRQARRRDRYQLQLLSEMREAVTSGLEAKLGEHIQNLLDRIDSGELDPYAAVDRLCSELDLPTP